MTLYLGTAKAKLAACCKWDGTKVTVSKSDPSRNTNSTQYWDSTVPNFWRKGTVFSYMYLIIYEE